MWMSEARCSTAREMMRLTMRTTGASLARSRSRWTSSSAPSSPCSPRGLDDLADRAAAAEHALERGLDVGRHADPGQHRLAGEQLHRADRVAVERVGHRDREAVLGLGERQDARLLEEVGAHPLAVQRQVGIVGLARERQLEQLGERLGDVALGDQAELRQQHVQALVVGLLDPLRAGEPGAVEPAALAQPSRRAPGRPRLPGRAAP